MEVKKIKNNIDKTIIDDFRRIAKNNGVNADDFNISENDITQHRQGIFPLDLEVTVTHVVSRKSKLYKSGHGTNWLAEFEQDLSQGFYS